MSDILHGALVLIGACLTLALFGGSFIFGVAFVCRWMEWAPINTTIHINNYGETKGFLDSAKGKPE